MWHTVELHSPSAKHGGLAAALSTALARNVYYHIVDQRRLANHRCDSSPDGVEATLAALDGCSVTYIGIVHMDPAAPFSAFSIASDAGIAYLEHLIDYEPITDRRFRQMRLASGLHNVVRMLLVDHEAVSTVVLPLAIDGAPAAGFHQIAVDDRYHITRVRLQGG